MLDLSGKTIIEAGGTKVPPIVRAKHGRAVGLDMHGKRRAAEIIERSRPR